MFGLLVLLLTPRGRAAEVSVDIGSPYSSVRALLPVSGSVSLGPRLDLLDARALRPGISFSFGLSESERASLVLDLCLARAFGLSAISTFDAELVPELTLSLDTQTEVELRGGLLVYLGSERSQRGVVALGSLGLRHRLSEAWHLRFELGWMGDRFVSRPTGGVGLEWSNDVLGSQP